jgi:catecholate siderophore receptor
VAIQDSRIAVAVSLALAAAAAQGQAPAPAPTQNGTDSTKTMSRISVEATETEETPKVDRVSSPKFSQDLLDTPQTIAVVSKEVLQQQGATSLTQALRNTPGVTFLLGENGNTATGDSIFMRGFDTQGSIFIDGIRDLGTVTRDTFNTEQVEVAKGPAGPDYGRGAASGYVNLASKVPGIGDFNAGSASYGTANNARITGDINHRFEGTGTAFRLNLMGQDGDVDGRNFIERQGWSVAPSLAFGLEGDTRTYFYLLHTEQENIPDGGVSTIGLEGFYNPAFDPSPLPAGSPPGPNAGVVPEPVDTENFYGFGSDFEEIKGTMFTARIEHDFSDTITLRNTTRYGKLDQFYVLTGVNALTVTDPNPDVWTVARTRQAKFQENSLLTNQTNIAWNVSTGGVDHAVTGGFEFIDEEQYNPTYVGLGTAPPANVYNPNRNDVMPDYAPVRNGVYTRGETQTAGVYLFDTMSFAEKWQFTAGFRVDSFETDFDSAVLSTAITHPTLPVGTLVPANAELEDTLFSYKVGLVYKPVENGSIYVSHAISQQPPGGTNFIFSSNPNNANQPNLDPQKGINYELGAKWEFHEGAFAVTGAIFHTTNENELWQDPSDPTVILQIGERQVEGIELGFVGKLTESWELSAGVADMESEIVRGLANQQGLQINWTPELTFTSWTTYHTPFGLSIGGGVRYVDTVSRPVSTNTTTPVPPPDKTNMLAAPDYWVVDAMVSYAVNDNLNIQLNGYNLADEDYVAALNNSGARYSPGTPRSALLTVNFTF